MSGFFKPYEGNRPFLFISYAHKQSAEVVDTIRILHDSGIRLWYDEGIPAGSDWPANIADHMQNCEKVIFFLSKDALASPNCYSEMRTAQRLNRPVLVVRLDQSEVTENWRSILEGKETVPCLPSEEERARAVRNTGFLTRRYYRSWRERIPWRILALAASLLLFLVSAAAFYAIVSGRWSPYPEPPRAAEPAGLPAQQPVAADEPEPESHAEPVRVIELGEAEKYFAVSFPDRQQEKAVRQALGKEEETILRWEVAEIQELYFCGNMVTSGLEHVTFLPDGSCSVNDAPVITGQVSDLSLLQDAARLETLALICQPVQDLTGLSSHLLLRKLYLSGSEVASLASLTDLPSLEEIDIAYTAISDLRPLESLPKLKTVYVSRDMLPLRWSENASFRVILTQDAPME